MNKKRNTLKILSCFLFSFGIIMIIVALVLPLSNKNTIPGWSIMKEGDVEYKKDLLYQNNKFQTITLNSMNEFSKNQYFINIPQDMFLYEYSANGIIYKNNNIEFNYTLNVSSDKSYDEYMKNVLNDSSVVKIYKRQVSDNINAFLLMKQKDNIFTEDLLILLKDNNYYNQIKISSNNCVMDNSLVNMIIESLSSKKVDLYSRCYENRCELILENTQNKKIIYNLDHEKYQCFISNIEYGNELEYFLSPNDKKNITNIRIKLEYYYNKEILNNLFSDTNLTIIKSDKYKIYKKNIDSNSQQYYIILDDNIFMTININRHNETVNIDEIFNDFLNFTYE